MKQVLDIFPRDPVVLNSLKHPGLLAGSKGSSRIVQDDHGSTRLVLPAGQGFSLDH